MMFVVGVIVGVVGGVAVLSGATWIWMIKNNPM
jgi:hypothetical protein